MWMEAIYLYVCVQAVQQLCHAPPQVTPSCWVLVPKNTEMLHFNMSEYWQYLITMQKNYLFLLGQKI